LITKEDEILIKNLCESKKYEARRLIDAFQTKKTGADESWNIGVHTSNRLNWTQNAQTADVKCYPHCWNV